MEEPEIPENVSRNTETLAFRRMAAVARIKERTRNHMTLSGLHVELVRLERAAMQHLPHLTYDERMEFIAESARLRNISPRQTGALLNQASDIIMLRDLHGMATSIEDYSAEQIERMRFPRNNSQRKGRKAAAARAA